MRLPPRETWRPLTGGRNNDAFALEIDERPLCLKVYRIDARRRGRREWAGLTVAQAAAPGVAPEPVAADLDERPERVLMERVDGAPLTDDPDALAAYADAIDRVHRSVRSDTPGAPDWPTIATPAYLVDKLDRLVAAPVVGDAREIADDLRRRWTEWRDGPERALLDESAPPVFSQGDRGLNNALWDGRRIVLIDWEYSGWTDRAIDLADVVEHGQSRAVSDETWEALLETFALPAAERARLAAARRLFAFFWAGLWWPQMGEDVARFVEQAQRSVHCRQP